MSKKSPKFTVHIYLKSGQTITLPDFDSFKVGHTPLENFTSLEWTNSKSNHDILGIRNDQINAIICEEQA